MTRRPSTLLLNQPSIVEELLVALRRLRQEQGLAILLVEQKLQFANALADRAYLMIKGRVAREIAPSALLSDPEPRSEYPGVSAGGGAGLTADR